MTPTKLEGSFLVAMPNMGDARFESTVIFLCAHTQEGAMGFVVNAPMTDPSMEEFFVRLNVITDLERDSLQHHMTSKLLHTGGPVEPGRGFVLHSPDFKGEGTIQINDEVCLTATLEILRAIAKGQGPERYLLTLGYSGWSPGQLEEEISANGWLVAKHSADIIFDSDHEEKYQRIMNSMGIDPILLSGETGHA